MVMVPLEWACSSDAAVFRVPILGDADSVVVVDIRVVAQAPLADVDNHRLDNSPCFWRKELHPRGRILNISIEANHAAQSCLELRWRWDGTATAVSEPCIFFGISNFNRLIDCFKSNSLSAAPGKAFRRRCNHRLLNTCLRWSMSFSFTTKNASRSLDRKC